MPSSAFKRLLSIVRKKYFICRQPLLPEWRDSKVYKIGLLFQNGLGRHVAEQHLHRDEVDEDGALVGGTPTVAVLKRVRQVVFCRPDVDDAKLFFSRQ